jgi:hypothetical protein
MWIKENIMNKKEAEDLIKNTRKISDFCELNRIYCSECKGTETGEDGIIVHKDYCDVKRAEGYLESLKNESQIEKCLELSADLFNEFVKLPLHHPSERDEFALAIHSVQDKLALKIAQIHRPDLFPNKVNND